VAKLRINIDVPSPGNQTVAAVIGLVGAVGVSVSIGGLIGTWWWSALVGSLFALFIAAVTHYDDDVRDDHDVDEHGPAAAPHPPEPRVRFGVPDPDEVRR
jgi:hypothetical protein